MTNQINAVFGEVPTELDKFITASQIVQAEAMKYFVEFWRMDKGERNGILWWNLRDGWPIISDAVVDYYGGKKLAYYFIKQVQTDVCVMIGDAVNGKHQVVAVNDTRGNNNLSVTIKDADTQKIIFSKTAVVDKNGKALLGSIPETNIAKMWIIEWDVNGRKSFNHYLAYNPPLKLDDYMKWLPLLRNE
jgi:beta-mannosidase